MLSIQPIEHVKFLCAEIGPRGPTTEAEARAAAYAAARLEETGAHEVTVEPFRSVPSLWRAFEIGSVIALSSTALFFGMHGRWWIWSILLCIVALLILVGEVAFWRYSLSNLLPKRISQNVYGKIPAKGEVRKRLVFIGHLDTNRTPKLFHPRIVRHLSGIFLFTLSCLILKMPVFAVSAISGMHAVGLAVALLLDLPILVLLGVILHGDYLSPFTEGANDNATGAAVVLSLAELLSRDPLRQTEVWGLCTGCEEATLTGIKAFLDRHGDRLSDAYFIDLECLGIGSLRYITQEGMLKRYHSNTGLVRAMAAVSEQSGDTALSPAVLKRGYTESAIVIGRGFKGITIMALPDGSDEVPHWHQTSDRIENIDSQNLNKAVHFLVAVARELDSD